jgi:predicted nucleic acid-binding Zn ribbon protein
MLPDHVDLDRCPKCGAATPAGERFCSGCGADVDAERLAVQIAPKMRRARNWILAVGIVYLVTSVAFVAAGMVPDEAKGILLGINGALCAIHIGLFFWAKSAPFAAAVVALVLFVTVHVANAVLDPTTIAQGIVIKAAFLAALIAAVRSGHEVVVLRGRAR